MSSSLDRTCKKFVLQLLCSVPLMCFCPPVQEDQAIVRYVAQYGNRRWTQIASMLQGRTSKQCRERLVQRANSCCQPSASILLPRPRPSQLPFSFPRPAPPYPSTCLARSCRALHRAVPAPCRRHLRGAATPQIMPRSAHGRSCSAPRPAPAPARRSEGHRARQRSAMRPRPAGRVSVRRAQAAGAARARAGVWKWTGVWKWK